jgi:putative DNA-invertase from lambdoid prophage Rac
MNVALYLRVSTGEQYLEPQLIELRQFCQTRGWNIVRQFEDRTSGGSTSRPALDEMMACVRQRAFDGVLVVKLDRLARSLRHFAQLVDEFAKHDVAFIVTSQGIDTSRDNAAGRLQMQILAAVAEFERGLIRERVRAGLCAARQRGKVLGRPSLALRPDWQAVVAQHLAEHGRTKFRALAAALGGVSTATAWTLAGRLPA